MHIRPRGGSGSSCADRCGSMTGGNVRALGSFVQSGHSSVGGTRRTSSQLLPGDGRRPSTHVR